MVKKSLLFSFFLLNASILSAQNGDILSLSVEDLSQINIDNTVASLTTIDNENVPASVTVITDEEILQSGARSLDELLEIYVPSFAYMYKIQGSQMGMRGIISDRNNKILLLVNGKVMNVKASDGGALTERFFSLLGDIRRVTVIRDPGSAIYGAGAIAGVINIETYKAEDIDTIRIESKVGSDEDFFNFQLNYAYEFDDASLYLYYGVDKYNGADREDAPLKFAYDIDRRKHGWPYIPAQTPFPYDTTNDNGSFEGHLRHKLHLQVERKNLLFWARLTKSSQATPTEQQALNYLPVKKGSFQKTGEENQQLTFYGEYRDEISDKLEMHYAASYMRSDMIVNFAVPGEYTLGDRNWGEDNFMLRFLLNYDLSENDKFAFGSEYNYDKFGRESGLKDLDFSKINGLPKNTRFDTNTISFFTEYQKSLYDTFHIFAGIRVDKHKYSPWLYSPRFNLVYDVDSKNIFKFGFSRSVRHSDDADLYRHYKNTKEYGDVEQIETLEAIYTHRADAYRFDFTGFFNSHDVVSFNDSTKHTEYIGSVDSYGFEAEFGYEAEKYSFYLSHAYTKLIDFSLEDEATIVQNVSASVKGFGNDFANWHNHITKMRFNYSFSKDFHWISSMRIFWGMPGAKDMADYNIALNDEQVRYHLAYYTDDKTRAFEESIYLNSALQWKIDTQTTLTINGYNLLGLFEQSYNKRNFFQRTSQYRESAPAVSIGIRYEIY